MGLALNPSRPPRAFIGREPELAELTASVEWPGLTVVAGRPQIGKSRLLQALDERLTAQGALVGRAESSGQEPDLLLRAVAQCYGRWLAASSWREQAASLNRRFAGKRTTIGL